MAEIITLGEVLVEVMAHNTGQKFNETGLFQGPFPSGAPAIFIDQAAKVGSSTVMISAVGNDGFGQINLDRLQADGVDVSKIQVLDDQTTGVAFVTYKEDGDRDFIFHITNAACGYVDETFVTEDIFKDCNYFHIMGSSIYNEGVKRAIIKGMELAKKHGCKISFDPNVRKEIVTDTVKKQFLFEILKQSHIILAGEDELFYLTGIEDEQESVQSLIQDGQAEAIIIKRGSRGATLFTSNLKEDISPYKVDEVDPTGAGDCFAGTFISCINQGIDVVKAARLATIAGAKAVTKKGPMEGNTSLRELEDLL